mmetsp:Transcript_16463/g.27075  ORF Transcript_16463/g.27075 Transcript_16463/m.27075 type:complete len:105 (+) Transcript_16463:1301-1615(+)
MSGARVVGIEDEYDAVMNGVDVGRDATDEKLAPVLAGCVTFFGPKPSAANLSRRDVLGLPNEGNSSSVTLPAAVFFKRLPAALLAPSLDQPTNIPEEEEAAAAE